MKNQVAAPEGIRGIYIGSFGGPKFDSKGHRLLAGMAGKHPRLYNNRTIRMYWKERGSTELPLPPKTPSPSPERVESNSGKGSVGRGRLTGVPCETQRSDICCKRKAFALGPKKVRLCVPCLKAAWNRQGFCPLRIVVLQHEA